ncbi:MAG: hypothetical protein ACLSVG_00210 [Clostridia bacterium]
MLYKKTDSAIQNEDLGDYIFHYKDFYLSIDTVQKQFAISNDEGNHYTFYSFRQLNGFDTREKKVHIKSGKIAYFFICLILSALLGVIVGYLSSLAVGLNVGFYFLIGSLFLILFSGEFWKTSVEKQICDIYLDDFEHLHYRVEFSYEAGSDHLETDFLNLISILKYIQKNSVESH